MYFLRTVWNFIGPCSLQARITIASSQDCSDYGFRTTYIIQTVEGKSGSYKILQEVYQSLCTNHNTYGKFVEQGKKVPMEQGLLEGFGQLKEKNSDHTDFDHSILEQGVPCSCRCIIHSVGSSAISTKGGRHRSPNFFCK